MTRGLPTPSPSFRAYLAGYFDAEGCVRVAMNHGRFWQASIMFQQVKPIVLERIQQIYGGVLRRSGNKTCWQMRRYAVVACFLNDVLPFLGEKRSQAQMVLDRFASRLSRSDGRALVRDLAHARKRRLKKAEVPSTKRRRAPCSFPQGCHSVAVCRGLCGRHYQQAKRDGAFTVGPRNKPRAFAYVRIPNETDLNYFAGYFDGDGNIDVQRIGRTWHVRIAFEQTFVDGVKRIWEVYGGSLQYLKKTAPNRPAVAYRLIAHEAVMKFLRDIRPYTIEKALEIDLILFRYRTDLTNAEAFELLDELERLRWPSGRSPYRKRNASRSLAIDRVVEAQLDDGLTAGCNAESSNRQLIRRDRRELCAHLLGRGKDNAWRNVDG